MNDPLKNEKNKKIKKRILNINTKIKKEINKNEKNKKRLSPLESATLYPINTQKIGNDRNMWIIIETKNKIKRWKKL